jgi:hypothetical protein
LPESMWALIPIFLNLLMSSIIKNSKYQNEKKRIHKNKPSFYDTVLFNVSQSQLQNRTTF